LRANFSPSGFSSAFERCSHPHAALQSMQWQVYERSLSSVDPMKARTGVPRQLLPQIQLISR
jgi:hypothetical protein